MAGSHNGAVTTSAAEPLPDDVETLKTMLLAERQAHRTEVHNQALLIEQLKHQIARLRHERFGQSSERRALLDQLEALYPSRDGPMSPCCAARSISGGLSAELGSSSPGHNREPTTRHLKLSRMAPVRAANSSFWSSFVSSDVCTITIRVLGLTVTNWPRKPLK